MVYKMDDIFHQLKLVKSAISTRVERIKQAEEEEEAIEAKRLSAFRKLESEVIIPALQEIKKRALASGYKSEISEDDDKLGHGVSVICEEPAFDLSLGIYLSDDYEEIFRWANITDTYTLYEADHKKLSDNITEGELLAEINNILTELLTDINNRPDTED
jgi:hypothetical protein